MRAHTGGKARRSVPAILIVLLAATAAHADSLEEDAATAISKAVASGDYATALAWEDVLELRNPHDSAIRAERSKYFGKLVDTALAKIGPPTAANAEAVLGTLLALRVEANRSLGTDSGAEARRRTDLAPVVDSKITPKLVEVAAILWVEVDAMSARREDARAVLLAELLIAETPGGADRAARIAPLRQRIADAHLGLAKQAEAEYPAARALHARIAKLFGADVGELSEPGNELINLFGRNWLIDAQNSCGDVAFGIEDATQRLDLLLAKTYSPGRGELATLRVTFDGCPIKVRDWQTVEERGYMAKGIVRERVEVPGAYTCGNWSSTSDKGASSTTVTSTRYCGTASTGQYTWKDHEVDVERTAKTLIDHRVSRMTATGAIKVELYGVTREVPFSLEAESDDDPASRTKCDEAKDCPPGVPTPSKSRHGWSAGQARLRVHDKLTDAIATAVGKVVAEKAASYVTQAGAAVAAGRGLEADHAFAIAFQLGSRDPAFEKWAETQYRLPRPVLLAGLGSGVLPRLELATTYAVKLPAIKVRDYVAEARAAAVERAIRETLWFTFTAGPMFANTTGGTERQMGGIASMQVGAVIGRPLVMFGFTGGYGANHGLIELNLVGGYGVTFRGLALHAVSGLGMNTSTGNQERIGPTPNDFIVPVAIAWQYGARLSYTARFNLKLEAMYTKTFRASSELASEKRLDARLILFNAAVTMRYAEYLADVDGFLPAFDADARSAKTFWLLGGGGF